MTSRNNGTITHTRNERKRCRCVVCIIQRNFCLVICITDTWGTNWAGPLTITQLSYDEPGWNGKWWGHLRFGYEYVSPQLQKPGTDKIRLIYHTSPVRNTVMSRPLNSIINLCFWIRGYPYHISAKIYGNFTSVFIVFRGPCQVTSTLQLTPSMSLHTLLLHLFLFL
jgi:hypothetical protein